MIEPRYIRDMFDSPDSFADYVTNDYMYQDSLKRMIREAEADPTELRRKVCNEFDKFVDKSFLEFWCITSHNPIETIRQLWDEPFTVATFKAKFIFMQKMKWVEDHLPDVSAMSDPLHTPEAKKVWRKLQAKGWIDINLQPCVSNRKAAIIASAISDALKLEPRWAALQQLWPKLPPLSAEYSKAMDCKYFDSFLKEVTNALK